MSLCVCVTACWGRSRRQTEVSSVRRPLGGFLCQFDGNRSGFRAWRLAFGPCDGWRRAWRQPYPRMNPRLFFPVSLFLSLCLCLSLGSRNPALLNLCLSAVASLASSSSRDISVAIDLVHSSAEIHNRLHLVEFIWFRCTFEYCSPTFQREKVIRG